VPCVICGSARWRGGLRRGVGDLTWMLFELWLRFGAFARCCDKRSDVSEEHTAHIFRVTELFSCWVPADVKTGEPTRRPSLKLVKRDWRKLRKEEDEDFYCSKYRGRDSSVGIVTCYGLDGPRIESRYGRIFLPSSRPALRPTQPPIRCVQCHSSG